MRARPFEHIVFEIYAFAARRWRTVALVACAVLLFDVAAVGQAVRGGGPGTAAVYFLDVGQGDSELIVFPDGATMLVDGGPLDGGAYETLGRILAPEDRTLDVVMMSHPQVDHYGGLVEVARRYRVGVFVSNGETSGSETFAALAGALDAAHVPRVALSAGDAVRHGEDVFTVLSPAAPGAGASANDDALVGDLVLSGARIFFAADADASVEDAIVKTWREPVDVLKVAHHGSKYGTTQAFLDATRPRAAVIEVGENSYGHPAAETLARLADAKVFRTDRDGTLEFAIERGSIRVFALPTLE